MCLYLYICADVPHTSSVIKNMLICRRRVNQLLICTSTNLSGSFWCCHCFPHWIGCVFIYIYTYFNWRLLYNFVLVLPYINMNPPRVYMCSQSWTPLLPPSPYHPSGSSQRTSPEHPVSCIEPRLAIRFLYDIRHGSMPLFLFFFLFSPSGYAHGLQDLSSPTRDWTWALGSESTKS